MSAGLQPEPSLGVGDHAPVFSCNDSEGDLFDFYVDVTGKPIVFIFCGDTELKDLPKSNISEKLFEQNPAQVITFVSGEESDAKEQKTSSDWPFRTVADSDGDISSGFANLSGISLPAIFVLDPNQRVAGLTSLEDAGDGIDDWLAENISRATYTVPSEPVKRAIPVLTVPRVFEPEDCDWLINLWKEGERTQGQVSLGATADAKRDVVKDIKRREDYVVKDPEIEQRILNRMMPRLVPEFRKVLHLQRWEMEALRIGCYKASDAGFFKVHRDNCNPSVANRKYAITVNLNTGEYEGGNLRFPEYGQELLQPPRGGAIVFSCSLLHEVLPVTSGERFALLTFLR